MQTGISFSVLPRTFRDAIALAQGLGYRYIWIDSLCIIQDSSEDWTQEATVMGDVYGNSALNIAAIGAKDSSERLFFFRDPEIIKTTLVSIKREEPKYSRIRTIVTRSYYLVSYQPSIWTQEVEESGLNRRAWVFQERMLSPGGLHFGSSQILLGCRCMRTCESYPNSLPENQYCDGPNTKAFLCNGYSRDLQNPEPHTANHGSETTPFEHWRWIVETFTRGGLTILADKLPALSGIVAEIHQVLHDGTYFAGLWRKTLLQELICVTNDPASFRLSGIVRAPSWSWASVEGAISYVECHAAEWMELVMPASEIVDVQIKRTGVSDDCPSSGYIVIRGPMGIATCSVRPGKNSQKPVAYVNHIKSWKIEEQVDFSLKTEDELRDRVYVVFDNKRELTGPQKLIHLLPLYGMDDLFRNIRSWPTITGLVLHRLSDGRLQRFGRFELGRFDKGDIAIERIMDSFPKHTVTII